MKKYAIFLVISLSLNFSILGQYLDYVSLGFNTIETTRWDGNITTKHFLLNNSIYSKMAIYTYGLPQPTLMFEENNGNNIYIRYFSQDRYDYSYRKLDEGYFFINKYEIWRMENERLVYVHILNDDLEFGSIYREVFAQKIEYTQSGLTVYLTDGMILNYYNIPENELFDKFMTKMVCELLYIINNINNYLIKDIETILRNMTSRELAIFRNCLFLKYQYAFLQPMWIDFFNKYYDNNYQGTYSNSEVIEKLGNNEKWLLDLILQYERG